MRAAVLLGGTARIEEVPLPVPARGEVRIRVQGCGVCGSDVPVWRGQPWFSYPREPGAPGHETWGVVDANGEGVDLLPGTRVAGLTYNGYAEYDLADAAHLVALSRELEDQPFPGEALGCAVNVFRRSAVGPGDTVAVLGIGFLGALVTQLCARAGAHVIAVSRRRSALGVGRAMGAREVLALDEPVIDRVTALTDSRLCDVVIEAAGVQATLELAAPLTRQGGRLVIAGFHQDGPRQIDIGLWNWRALDIVNAHERDQRTMVDAIETAAGAVARGELDPHPLYTHRFRLAEIGDAMETVIRRPAGFMKALVQP